MLLLCSFFRLKELFQVKKGVTASLLFFFENTKNLSRSDYGKPRKKRGWPYKVSEYFIADKDYYNFDVEGVMQKRESPDFLCPVVGISAVMGLYHMQDYI